MSKSSKKYLSGTELEAAIEDNKFIYNEHYYHPYADSIIQITLDTIEHTYFRSEMVGFDDVPERNHPDVPLIYASNHSGMAFPWDAMVFGAVMYRWAGYNFKNAVRGLSAPMLSQSKLMNPYMVPNLWKKAGAIDATSINFDTMMRYKDSNVLIYPEGVPGIGKGFNKKYKLQKFSTSFIRMALKYGTDIIPVHVVNGEYIHPYSYTIPWVNRLVNKIGIPFLPISPILLFILLQPWMFYFAFPAQLTYVRGKRISLAKWNSKPYEEMSNEEIETLRDHVHAQMQVEMDEAVKKYGQKPYKWGDLWKSTKANLRKLPFSYPFAWPLVFLEFDRRWNDSHDKTQPLHIDFAKESFWKLLWKNPMVIAYFIPLLGWIPLAYRGLKGRDTEIKMWQG